jgi:SAM-dependent methyltransferase
MISPNLYKNGRTYDFFMKALGYEGSIDRFLDHLEIDCRPECSILDAGCGTGILGLHFLERFPNSSLHATDIEGGFLRATLANAHRRDIDRHRVTIGVGDISSPHCWTSEEGTPETFEDGSFDLICLGAVIGYASDREASLRQLVQMLSPGGYLLNIEMNESLTGRLVSNRYRYRNISLERMKHVIRQEGCELMSTPLRIQHLPAKLTRTAIVARKLV